MDETRTPETDLAAAKVLYAEGQLHESQVAFEDLLKSKVRGDSLYGLAMIALKRGDSDSAQMFFEQSLGVKRNNPNALYYLARALLRQGGRYEVIALLGEALSYDPRHEAALREISQLIGDIGHADLDASQQSEPSPLANAAAGTATSRESAPARARLHPPRAPQDPAATVGIVRNLSKGVGPWRGTPAALQIWTFRVETYDGEGTPGGLVGVEIRGHEIAGTLDSGDWVEIDDEPEAGEGLRPKEVRNLTTSDVVKARYFRFTTR